jgi:hypothetical protein
LYFLSVRKRIIVSNRHYLPSFIRKDGRNLGTLLRRHIQILLQTGLILGPAGSAWGGYGAWDLRDGTFRTAIKPPRACLGLSGGGERGQETHAERCCHRDSWNVAFHFLILFSEPIVTARVWQLKPDSLIVLSQLLAQVCSAET